MKVLINSVLAGVAFGDLRRMEQTLKRIHDTSPNGTLRGLGDWSDSFFDKIDGYGCWCYFGDDHGKGMGKPLNAVDEMCKILQNGYECVLMDRQAAGDNDCVPWDQPYGSGTTFAFLQRDDPKPLIRKMCQRSNRKQPNKECAELSCNVETFFTVEVFRYLMAGSDYNRELEHARGFEPVTECPTGKGQFSDRECCGTYPIRFPYKTVGASGNRECCGEHTFWTQTSQCCPGNVVKVSC